MESWKLYISQNPRLVVQLFIGFLLIRFVLRFFKPILVLIYQEGKLPTKTDVMESILYTKNLLPIEFIKWKIRDIWIEKLLHLYGIKFFYGQYGQGKTISLVNELMELRKLYGDNIVIATNFFYNDEDYSLTPEKNDKGQIVKQSWELILDLSYMLRKEFLEQGLRRPLVIGYDEIQNEFNSREYKNFPADWLRLLTQNRKGAGVKILGTAQHFYMIDKNLRELSLTSVDCTTRFGRLTHNSEYYTTDYIKKEESKGNFGNNIKNISSKWFVQTDLHRNAFDSFQFLDSALLKGPATLEEMRNVDSGQPTIINQQIQDQPKKGLLIKK